MGKALYLPLEINNKKGYYIFIIYFGGKEMKRTAAFLVAILLLALSVLPAGAVAELGDIDKPYGIVYKVYNDTVAERVSVSCLFTDAYAGMAAMTNEESMKKYGITDIYTYIQIDYRIDGGEWQYEEVWETTPNAPTYGGQVPKGDTVRTFDLLYLVNETTRESVGELAKTNDKGQYVFDLDNHKLEFRMRTSMGYTKDRVPQVAVSDWTDSVEVKRDADFGKAPTQLEAPDAYNPHIGYLENSMPYLAFDVRTPESIKKAEAWLSTQQPTYISMSAEIDRGGNVWEAVDISSASSPFANETKAIYLNPTDVDDVTDMRVRIRYIAYVETPEGTKTLYSDYSDVLEFEVPRWEEGKGILHERCKVCGICKPIFGQCMFVLGGIVIVILIVVAIPVKMHFDKVKKRKAAEEAEKQRRLEEERKAQANAKKNKNKNKNKK